MFLIFVFFILQLSCFMTDARALQSPSPQKNTKEQSARYAGSASCRQCHEEFYKLWAPSHHGLAMQPYTAEFAEKELHPQKESLKIRDISYLAEIGRGRGWVKEISSGKEKKYPIEHVMGGKNVYYFLTSLNRGRLQTLPVAYDVQNKRWFDTAASGIRHFPGAEADEPVHWTDPLYTFNTSCYNCHVSQLSTNYDFQTDTYHTKWAEPGINCETCHGPGDEHVKVCEAAVDGEEPKDLRIISTKTFTNEQTNSMCNSCHAKESPVSPSFKPGESYFDHFDLIALEHPDFYPDGRDLGENYTMTSWLMSPCVKSGKLNCMHCHTSSGRYRFKQDSKANNACLPCHKSRVEKVIQHSRHPLEDSEGNKCISCHMPMTQFARMNRTDHSMRPPTPAATLAFNSPNACNLCHKDKDEDAEWADQYVRSWHKNDYQKAVLDKANLVQAARNQNWHRLNDILNYIQSKDRDEIIAASLVRLLRPCDSDEKWPVLINVLQNDPSPLLRSAAANNLDGFLTSQSLKALLEATRDEYRLVRVRAAAALATVSPQRLKDEYQKDLQKATDEYLAGLQARADDYINHYNMGNFYLARQDLNQAVNSFETSIRLRPDYIASYVNMAFAHNAAGRNDRAETAFRNALKLEPNSPLVNLNIGMLLSEMGRLKDSEEAFRKAWESDPNSAVAAYNLGVMTAQSRPDESILWCQRAYKLRPEDGKYGYTYAFYLYQNDRTDSAVEVLQGMVNRQLPYVDAYVLLGAIHLRASDYDKADDVYRAGSENKKLPEAQRKSFAQMLQKKKRRL